MRSDVSIATPERKTTVVRRAGYAYPLPGGGERRLMPSVAPRGGSAGSTRRHPLRAGDNDVAPGLHNTTEGNPFAQVLGMPLSMDSKSLRAGTLRFRWNGSYGYRTLYLLTGQQTTNTATLMHVGARHYSPSLHRWLQRDPIDILAGDPNLYIYCGNNPVSRVDPWGLDCKYLEEKFRGQTPGRMVFNGNTLSIYNAAGDLIAKIAAYSGMPGACAHDQSKKGYGPIPEGTYLIDPSEDQFLSYNPLSWLGVGYPPRDRTAWGDRKIPIHPRTGTNTLGRGGFFLHGGTYVDTAGCVDIGPCDIPLIDWIGQHNTHIPFIVNYSGQSGRVPEKSPGKPYSWDEWRDKLRRWQGAEAR